MSLVCFLFVLSLSAFCFLVSAFYGIFLFSDLCFLSSSPLPPPPSSITCFMSPVHLWLSYFLLSITFSCILSSVPTPLVLSVYWPHLSALVQGFGNARAKLCRPRRARWGEKRRKEDERIQGKKGEKYDGEFTVLREQTPGQSAQS